MFFFHYASLKQSFNCDFFNSRLLFVLSILFMYVRQKVKKRVLKSKFKQERTLSWLGVSYFNQYKIIFVFLLGKLILKSQFTLSNTFVTLFTHPLYVSNYFKIIICGKEKFSTLSETCVLKKIAPELITRYIQNTLTLPQYI